MLGTMLASGRATLLRYDPNGKPPWRPLTEGSPTDGTPALLQLYELQGAQFSFVAKYLHTNTELLRLNLNNVKYNIQSETKHDITIDDGSIYSVKFLDAKEGNMFTTIVNNTIHEIKRAGADISRGRGRSIPLPGMVGLPNVQSPKEAWLPASGGQGAYRRPPPPPRPSNSTNGRQSDPQLDITFDNFKKAVASGDVRAATDFAKVLAEKRYNGSVDATTLPRPASYKDQMIK
ncbi:uncharacterized protein LOC102803206 [Saccoglossus kowalevskii]|uniref:Uncharacterized protein LOC102803206 isoform X1 n=1 Tax=Saccoglossus kowalevskii TaxID=10224 RepID=A0ABM0LVM4_SACKO|nr:PREDICTED: uncharacterized protein LOC102803206 isoform X1 [Saccoglossus kowalevskii]